MDKIFRPADILVPENCDMSKWSVIACDQFSSQPGYWDLVFVFTMLIIYLASYIESILKLEVYSLNAKNVLGTERLNLIVSLFSMSLVSIYEEMVYRRILFGYLYDLYSGCNKYIRIITSVIVSSIIFGSIHDGVFHLAMIQYIIYGISFSAIYLYTKRISSAITVHILVNMFIIIMRFF